MQLLVRIFKESDLDEKKKVAVIMTCFNRKEYTLRCIRKLAEKNERAEFSFIITDDNSGDGTKEALRELARELNLELHLIEGSGSLFWNGGMRKSIEYALSSEEAFDYAFLVNDDVDFYDGALDKMLERIKENKADAVVGATLGKNGLMTYGGQRKTSGFFAKFQPIEPSKEPKTCDTFNCNAVLVGGRVFTKAGNLDPKYTHSMGDYDYGMTLSKKGYTIINTADYVGICEGNDIAGSWLDPGLKRSERLKKKESPKGLPRKDWFHFVNKNYGLLSACYHSLTPYIKILIKK